MVDVYMMWNFHRFMQIQLIAGRRFARLSKSTFRLSIVFLSNYFLYLCSCQFMRLRLRRSTRSLL